MFNSKWFIVLLFFILLGTGLNGCNTVCPDKTTVNIGTTEVDADNNNKNKTQDQRSITQTFKWGKKKCGESE